jgi:ribonuclease VapC
VGAIVLDASAVIALLLVEPGAEIVRGYLPDVVISAVNLAEVVTKMIDRGESEERIRRGIAAAGMEVAPFVADDALRTGILRINTRPYGLSLGDRACLALAATRKLPVLTADRNWSKLNIGIDIRLARATP